MKRRAVLINLRTDAVEIAQQRGGAVRSLHRQEIDFPHDPAEWAAAVRLLGAELGSIVESLEIGGVGVHVLYCSPTHACESAHLPIRSASEACSAAELGCTEALPYSPVSAATASSIIGRSPRSELGEDGTVGKTHVVVAADRDDIVDAIAEMSARAGLQFESAIPIDAALSAALLKRTLKSTAHQGFLYIGERNTRFAVGGNGQIVFSRRLSMGVQALIEALTRPIRIDGQEAVTLTKQQASHILRAHGIAQRDTTVCAELALSGSDILPLLMPALQRFLVEIRQSLRFGIQDDAQMPTAIHIMGPGAQLPNLDSVLADELEIEVRSSPSQSLDAADSELDAAAEDLQVAGCDAHVLRELGLVPLAESARRGSNLIKRWLWTGAAAALVFVGFDAWRLRGHLEALEHQADAIVAREGDLAALNVTGSTLTATVSAMNELESNIIRETAGGVSLHAVLRELSRRTPGDVRLGSLSITTGEQGAACHIVGYALAPERADGQPSTLERYIDSLRQSPLLTEVVLGNVQMGAIQNIEGERFDAHFRVVQFPVHLNDFDVPSQALSAAEVNAP